MPAPTESRLATSASPTNNDDTLISTSSAAPPIDINVNYTPIDIIPSSAGITAGTTSIMASSPPGNATHYSTILTGDTPISREPVNKPNDYMIMSPPVSSSNKKAVTSEAIKHKPLSGLIDEFAMDDTSASNVTSPNSQSSYNPLLDEIAGTESNTEDSSAYMVMSPATSSSGGGSRMGTGPRKISHHIKLSNEKNASEDYMDMSPAGKNSTGVPIPNRNERALSFGTSPSAALTSHLVDYMKTNSSNSTSATSDYLVMSPVDPDKNPDFASAGLQPVGKTPPIKLRTSSIESNSSGARPKTTKGRFYRGQSDSQRSSLCFDEHWDLGISPQESSGATLMGPEINELDYAPLDVARSAASSLSSKAKLDSLKPNEVESKLRLDDFEPDELEEVSKHPRAYSVGARGSNSSVSTTGSGTSHWRHHKSRFIDIPGATTASGTSGTGTGSQTSSISPGTALMSTGQSPSTITARLGSWIRHRTGSVPSKSAVNGRRRHRTQSEGEKDEV